LATAQSSLDGLLGYTTLHLDTTVTRVPAQKLYQSLGYREVGRLDDNPDWICILYEKRFTEGNHAREGGDAR